MAAISEVSRRCVIWFGTPRPKERQALAAAGWQLRMVAPGQEPGIGLRHDDTVVALLDLRDDRDDIERVARQVNEHHYLRLILIGHEPIRPSLSGLATSCQYQFTTPLDLGEITQALGQLDPMFAAAPMRSLDVMVAQSPAMQASKAALRKFAPVELPVLITGETGTGKEVAARAIHELSSRTRHDFAAINCGALPSSLVQSELFGHERGAFTGAAARRLGLFESANGGTVFLDEIGDLPLDAQTNLLRVLQEGTIERVGSNQPIKVDVRVIAATHVDMEKAIAAGSFRADLYYRLNVLRLQLPPLRERADDVTLLADHFLAEFRQRHATRARGFSCAARKAMQAFSWPGNVRELLNRVQRAAVIAEHELIDIDDLDLDHCAVTSTGLDDIRAGTEREALLDSLKHSNFNVSACARAMQVSRGTVYRLCRKHGVQLDAMR